MDRNFYNCLYSLARNNVLPNAFPNFFGFDCLELCVKYILGEKPYFADGKI